MNVPNSSHRWNTLRRIRKAFTGSRTPGRGVLMAMVSLVLLWLFGSVPVANAKIPLDITHPTVAKLPVAIPDFVTDRPGPISGGELAQILRNDLALTGLFEIVQAPPGSVPSRQGETDFRAWAEMGVKTLILGSFSVKGDRLVIEGRLFDTALQKMDLGKRYTGRLADHRYMIHRLGDRIMEELTSIEGCFSSRIAFVGASNTREIFIMDYDGHNLGQLTHTKTIVMSPEWAPSNRSIIYTAYLKGNPDLWSLDLTSRRQSLISGRPGLNASARYSPSGDSIALSMTFKGIPKIFIITPQGNIIKRLTNGRGNDISPTWSPNGATIAYVSDRAGTPQIYTISAYGGSASRLTFESNYNTDPDWSPQGDLLAFTARIDGRFQICTIKADGTDFRVLTREGSSREPAWSPDGRMIAFASTRGGKTQIYVMDARGEMQVPVSPIPGKAPAWSPRGR